MLGIPERGAGAKLSDNVMCWGGMEVVDTELDDGIRDAQSGSKTLALFGRRRFEVPETQITNHFDEFQSFTEHSNFIHMVNIVLAPMSFAYRT